VDGWIHRFRSTSLSPFLPSFLLPSSHTYKLMCYFKEIDKIRQTNGWIGPSHSLALNSLSQRNALSKWEECELFLPAKNLKFKETLRLHVIHTKAQGRMGKQHFYSWRNALNVWLCLHCTKTWRKMPRTSVELNKGMPSERISKFLRSKWYSSCLRGGECRGNLIKVLRSFKRNTYTFFSPNTFNNNTLPTIVSSNQLIFPSSRLIHRQREDNRNHMKDSLQNTQVYTQVYCWNVFFISSSLRYFQCSGLLIPPTTRKSISHSTAILLINIFHEISVTTSNEYASWNR